MARRVVLIITSLLVAQSFSYRPHDIDHFLSRPDIKAPRLNVSVNESPAPGYLFLTPFAWTPQRDVNWQYGPYIYDNDGEVVWSGASAHPNNSIGTYNFQVCEFDRTAHLCYSRGFNDVWLPEQYDVVDDSYTTVKSFSAIAPDDDTPIRFDLHEFRLANPSAEYRDTLPLGAKTAIVSSRMLVEHNATLDHCEGSPTIQWVHTERFQEILLDGSDRVLFEWNAIDHVPISDTNQCPDEEPKVTGNGKNTTSSFDYFHLNSVDKDEDDNYLLSARHASTLYKIDGRTGEVIWRLGGNSSDFDLYSDVPDEPLSFHYQHHALYDNSMPDADGVSTLGITLWNNQNQLQDFGNKKANYSSGYSILLDVPRKSATLKQIWISPDRQLTQSQGSLQVLPNRNHLINMGNVPYLVEFDSEHNVVFSAHLGEESTGHISSYRGFRHEWTGRPNDKPALFAYASSCHDRVKFYVSWNGATEVKYWSLFAGWDREAMSEVISVSKDGFETVASGGSGTFAYAVALDENRQPIGSSEVIDVFVPAYELYDYCTEMHCGYGFDYSTSPTKSCDSATEPTPGLFPTLHDPSWVKNGTLEKTIDVPIRIQL